VVEDLAAAAAVAPRDPRRVAYTTQTTLAVDETEGIARVLGARFPALVAPRSDDICYATTNRQRAVRALAGRVDLLLVVGSANSSNSRRLVEVAARLGTRAHLIDDAGEVDPAWLAGIRRVGVSAGASAPEHLVDEVVACVAGFGPVTVAPTTTVPEDVRFAPPKEMS
jgi:4-hydroxy-3-methylbut-2-en-1-yl diphosphate reductase